MAADTSARDAYAAHLKELSREEQTRELLQFSRDMMDWVEQSDAEVIYTSIEETLQRLGGA